MRTQRKTKFMLIVAGLALIATIACCWFATLQGSAHTVPGESGSLTTIRAATSHMLPESVPSAVVSTLASRSAPSELLKKFNQSQNYRAFIYDVFRHPELGGYEYAGMVLAYCKLPVLTRQQEATLDHARAEAKAQLAARCDMSSEELDANSSQLFTLERKDPHADPLADLNRQLLLAENGVARQAAMAALLATADPTILLEIFPPGSEVGTDGIAHKGIYFDGNWYAGADETKIIFALSLAQCDLGLDCGPEASGTLALCATRGWCANGRADALRTGLPDQFEEIAKLAAAMTDAVKKGSVNVFLSPSNR